MHARKLPLAPPQGLIKLSVHAFSVTVLDRTLLCLGCGLHLQRPAHGASLPIGLCGQWLCDNNC